MHEPVFCPECGEVIQDAQRRLQEMQETIEELGKALAHQRIENRRLRTQNAAVPPELERDALDVLKHWQRKIQPSARELNGQRLRHTVDRLQHGYTVDDLKRSIDGFAYRPHLKYGNWVPPEQGGVFKADAQYLMANAARVDEGLRIADRYDPRPPAQVSLPL